MNIRFYLDKRARKRDVKSNRLRMLSVAISMGRTFKVRKTLGFSIWEDCWNNKKQCVKNGSVNSKGLQGQTVNKVIRQIQTKFTNLEFTTPKEQISTEFICEQLAQIFRNDETQGSRPAATEPKEKSIPVLYDIFANVRKRSKDWELNTVKYQHSVQKLVEAVWKNTTTDTISNDPFIDVIVYCIQEKKYNNNNTKKVIKAIGTFLQWCISEGYIKKKLDLTQPKIPTVKEADIYLTVEELARLRQLEFLERMKHLEQTRDFFLFCCYTGLTYANAIKLTSQNIQGSYLRLSINKEKKSLTIPLLKEAWDIIDKYKRQFGIRLLPPRSNQKMNKYLREICHRAGIDKVVSKVKMCGAVQVEKKFEKWQLISLSTARKTFIYNMLAYGMSDVVLMEELGLRDYNTIARYRNALDTDKAIEDAFERISRKRREDSINQTPKKINHESTPLFRQADPQERELRHFSRSHN